MIDLADQSSRMKDYYDLNRILNEEKYSPEILQEAITRTFENRHTAFDADTMFFRSEFADNHLMQTRWKAFLNKINKKESVSFNEVVRYLQQQLRPYWNNLQNE